MKSLSFREQAAIALYSMTGEDSLEAEDTIISAQFLADEACKQWGHKVIGGYRYECTRCGAKVE